MINRRSASLIIDARMRIVGFLPPGRMWARDMATPEAAAATAAAAAAAAACRVCGIERKWGPSPRQTQWQWTRNRDKKDKIEKREEIFFGQKEEKEGHIYL